MGNCLRHESPTNWGGEEWGSPVPENYFASNTRYGLKEKAIMNMEEEDDLLGHNNKGGLSLPSTILTTKPITEVKIKITKKQLEELLSRIDTKGLSLQQVLAQLLINGSSDRFESHQRSWRPNLQSIPE